MYSLRRITAPPRHSPARQHLTSDTESIALLLEDGTLHVGRHSRDSAPYFYHAVAPAPLYALSGIGTTDGQQGQVVALAENGAICTFTSQREGGNMWSGVAMQWHHFAAPIAQIVKAAGDHYARDERGRLHHYLRFHVAGPHWWRVSWLHVTIMDEVGELPITTVTSRPVPRFVDVVAAAYGIVALAADGHAYTNMVDHGKKRTGTPGLYPLDVAGVVTAIGVDGPRAVLHVRALDGTALQYTTTSYIGRYHGYYRATTVPTGSSMMYLRVIAPGHLHCGDWELPLPDGLWPLATTIGWPCIIWEGTRSCVYVAVQVASEGAPPADQASTMYYYFQYRRESNGGFAHMAGYRLHV